MVKTSPQDRLYVAFIFISSLLGLLKFSTIYWEPFLVITNFQLGGLFCLIIYITAKLNKIFIIFFIETGVRILASVNDWLELTNLYDLYIEYLHISLILYLIIESFFYLKNNRG